MKTKFQYLSLLCMFMACIPKTENNTVVASGRNEDWEQLIDNDLSNWDTFLSFQHEYTYDGTPPKK